MALTALTPGPSASQSGPIQSGRITYQYRAPENGARGVGTLAWRDGGRKFRNEMKDAAPSRGQAQMHTWTIGDGAHLYMYTAGKGKQVYRMKQPPGGAGLSFATLAGNKGRLTGTGAVAGKRCEIREIEGAKFWVWNDLVLKTELRPGQGVSLTATRVETGITLAPSLFVVPSGYKVVDRSAGSGR